MRSTSEPQKPKKKQLSFQFDNRESEPSINKRISENDSLQLSQFRLNKCGITCKDMTNVKSKFKDLRLEDLETVTKLGKGAYGTVDKVLHKPTGQYFALKVLYTLFQKIHYMQNEVQEELLKKELSALIKSDSPNVVRCYGAFYSKGEIYILMELMEMGSLQVIQEREQKINESLTMIILLQVLTGLEYLHKEMKITHRDIKPHNILINKKGEVKIADFGICSLQNSSDQKCTTFVGTTNYMSPERLNGEDYSHECDIWSVGVMALQCLTGKLPLEYNPKTMSMIEYVQTLKNYKVQEHLQGTKISDNVQQFIGQCLNPSALERSNATELLNTKAISNARKLDMNLFHNWLRLVIEEN